MTTESKPQVRAYIIHEGTKRAATVLLLNGHADEVRLDKQAVYLGMADGVLDVRKTPMKGFQKSFIRLAIGEAHPDMVAEQIAREMLALGESKKRKITPAAYDVLEGVLKMDTRGKSSAQIREECERIAADLPQGHALRAVPQNYPDRASAIAAYTTIRQALFSLNRSTTVKETTVGTKKVKTNDAVVDPKVVAAAAAKAAAEAAAKAAADAAAKAAADAAKKATKDGKAAADAAKAKAGNGKAKQDFSGTYKVTGDAAKAKTTEELGMHEDSVRTKVLAVAMKSKSEKGVPYAKLEEAAGDKTRGAVAYLVKKGFLTKETAAK